MVKNQINFYAFASAVFRGAYTLADFKASRVRAGASVYSSTISGVISLYVVCE